MTTYSVKTNRKGLLWLFIISVLGIMVFILMGLLGDIPVIAKILISIVSIVALYFALKIIKLIKEPVELLSASKKGISVLVNTKGRVGLYWKDIEDIRSDTVIVGEDDMVVMRICLKEPTNEKIEFPLFCQLGKDKKSIEVYAEYIEPPLQEVISNLKKVRNEYYREFGQ